MATTSSRYTEDSIDVDRIDAAFSSTHHEWRFYSASESPGTLLAALVAGLPHIAPHEWSSRLDFGGAFINGVPCFADTPLPLPAKVEYYEPRFLITEAHRFFAPFRNDYIVYRDEHLVVAYKPAKLPTMPAKEQRVFSLKSSLEAHLGQVLHMPSRLDMSTQGLVIASHHPDTHGPLQKLFQSRQMQKFYLLATQNVVDWQERTIDAPIGPSSTHPVLRAVTASGKHAVTSFRVLHRSPLDASSRSITLIEARPLTGRTHQIRVHARFGGFPILGDNFYGGAPADTLHLISHRLAFAHPITHRPVDILLPRFLYPAWAVWYKPESENGA